MNRNNKIGSWLARVRVDAGLQMDDVSADVLGQNDSILLTAYEKGKATVPEVTLFHLGHFYGLSRDEIQDFLNSLAKRDSPD